MSLVAHRTTTQRLLATSGLPPLPDADEAAQNSLDQVIDEWRAHMKPIIDKPPLSTLCVSRVCFVMMLECLLGICDSAPRARRGGQETRCEPYPLLDCYLLTTTV
jgi:hypothetical protein